MRKTSLYLCMLLSALIAAEARAAEEMPRTVSTQGEAIVYVVPDEVVVSFGVQTTDKSLDKARAANDEQSVRLVAALKAMGIEAKYIQTDAMNISIRYTDGRSLTIEGYEASRSYSVKLKDVKKFEALIDAGLKNGANQLQGFTYQTTELRKHRDKARAMAIVAAKEKATDLSAAVGCKVASPRTITESSGHYYYGGYNRSANAYAQNSVQAAPGGEGEGGETMPLGQIAVRANVSVTFDLIAP